MLHSQESLFFELIDANDYLKGSLGGGPSFGVRHQQDVDIMKKQNPVGYEFFSYRNIGKIMNKIRQTVNPDVLFIDLERIMVHIFYSDAARTHFKTITPHLKERLIQTMNNKVLVQYFHDYDVERRAKIRYAHQLDAPVFTPQVPQNSNNFDRTRVLHRGDVWMVNDPALI